MMVSDATLRSIANYARAVEPKWGTEEIIRFMIETLSELGLEIPLNQVRKVARQPVRSTYKFEMDWPSYLTHSLELSSTATFNRMHQYLNSAVECISK